MLKTATLLTILSLLLVFELNAQNSVKDFVPLKSNKTDVIKVLGEGQVIQQNILHYDLPNEAATFTFYNGGCEASIENQLKIPNGTVLEVKSRPKKIQDGMEFFPTYPNSNVFRDLDDNNSIIVNFNEGVVMSFKKTDGNGIVEIHYIPRQIKLPNCLISQMDSTSKYAFAEENYTFFRRCATPHTGLIGILSNEKKLRKYDYKELDRLAQLLKDCPHFIGRLIYEKKKGVSRKKNLEYINRLKNYLITEKIFLPSGYFSRIMDLRKDIEFS